MVRRVIVEKYNPRWITQYEAEAERLRKLLSDNLLEIHHIGSTAIPGLSAKPIIDIMPVVRDILAVDLLQKTFEQAGYLYFGEYGIPGRRFLVRGTAEMRLAQVHIFGISSPDIKRHLAFRDYLRVHPEAAAEYSSLKKSLAEKFPLDIDAYIGGKSGFVKDLEAKALKWYRQNPQH
ncbi:GrpB family protein [Dehalococcoides sp. THU3]|uniref:GrpB family protein n=1 Tax=Dehalococcoides TaxID=61434 RepID=UPI0005B5780C|nr:MULTISPECIES: GrpB family protein [Dehalococcoides]QYY58508.1 GrpB family protein [Dehalococcoides mccartyi]BAQ34184.1 hypothetical protein UCH007_02260 [Dehalococcoides sp. UCH007]